MRLDTNDYSGIHAWWVDAWRSLRDLQSVRVFAAGQLVADHDRCWAAHQTITDPAHAQAAVALRQQGDQSAAFGGSAGRGGPRLVRLRSGVRPDDGQVA